MPATKPDWVTQIANKPYLDLREYAFSRTSPGGAGANLSASGAGKEITLRPMPYGLAVGSGVRISGGTGTAETAAVTAVDGSGGDASGTITVTTTQTHTGAWSVASATAGFQEAVNVASAAGGGRIKVPAGMAEVYMATTITESSVWISGRGIMATKIVNRSSSEGVFRFLYQNAPAEPNGAWRYGVSDLSIAGNSNGNPYGDECTAPAIYTDSYYATPWFERLDIRHHAIAIDLWNTWAPTLSDLSVMFCRDYGVRYTSQVGKVAAGLKLFDSGISNNGVIYHTAANTDSAAIFVGWSGGHEIRNIETAMFGSGLRIEPAAGQWCLYGRVQDFWSDGALSHACYITGGGTVASQVFTDTTWAYATGQGIRIEATSDSIRFIGGRVRDCASHGIVDAAGVNHDFDNLEVAGNNREGGTGDGFFMNAVEQWSIRHCRIGNFAGAAAPNQQVGVTATAGCDKYEIVGNTFIDNTSAPIGGDASPTAAIIRDNIGYNPVGLSAITVEASPFTYTTGPTPEVVHIIGTITSVKRGSTTISTAAESHIPLAQQTSIVVTYPGAAPTMLKDVQ